MLIGLNYPWMNYGWDFGVPPPGWRAESSWQEEIAAQVPRWRELGIGVVRWFLLADGLALGAPRPASGQVYGLDWRLEELPPLSAAFLDDFECLLQCFSPEVQLLPVVLDFPVAFPGQARRATEEIARIWRTEHTRPGLPHGTVKGGRADLFRNPGIARDFVHRALGPLLERSRLYRRNIFAWEVINEPEWIVRGSRLGRPWHGLQEHVKVPAESMLEFCRSALNRIEDEGYRSTIGFTSAGMLAKWSDVLGGVPGYLPQHHHYPSKEEALPPDARGMLLGEFSTSVPRDRENAHARPWPELAGDRQGLEHRLALASARGYEAAFPWSYRARDAASGDWAAIADGLERYRSAP